MVYNSEKCSSVLQNTPQRYLKNVTDSVEILVLHKCLICIWHNTNIWLLTLCHDVQTCQIVKIYQISQHVYGGVYDMYKRSKHFKPLRKCSHIHGDTE